MAQLDGRMYAHVVVMMMVMTTRLLNLVVVCKLMSKRKNVPECATMRVVLFLCYFCHCNVDADADAR